MVLLLAGVACGNGDKQAPAQSAPSAPIASGQAASKGAPAGATAAAKTPAVPQAPTRGPEHAVYSLVANRLSAHLTRGGGLFIPAGSAGFVKYLRFRKDKLPWDIRKELDGKKVATIDGATGRIDIPVTAEQAAGSPTLYMRVHNPAARRMSVRINSDRKKEVGVELAAGWSTVSAVIPEGALRPGENEVLLFTSKGAPMTAAWFQLGGAAPAEGADADPSFYDADSASLLLPEHGGLSYYVTVPAKGRLTGNLSSADCTVRVRATPDEGNAIEGKLVGKGAAVDLAALSGAPVRLDLVAEGCEQARLADAALVVPGEAPAFDRAAQKARPKYVVLWIMDALRADRVRSFTPSARPESPTYDELAKSSSLFLSTYEQGNESKAGHAAIWVSQYPVRHHYFGEAKKLGDDWTKLDEVIKKAGMYASGVSANGYIIGRRGFGTKWDAFRNHIHEGGGLLAEDVLQKGIESIDGKTDPWFLYLGSIDTHVSWRAKEPWISQYDPKPYSGRFKTICSGADVGKIAAGKIKVTPRDIEHVRAIYDSNVTYQDQQLGILIDKLKEWGIADQTMLILTGDHGDEQWEAGGRVGHGGSLRETLVHVPLVFHYPPLFPTTKVAAAAESVDILPTIADVLGVDPDPEWQGRSLLPLAHGVGAGYPGMSMSSLYENAHVVRIGSWKLRAAGTAEPSVYDLARDPGEQDDVVGKFPIAQRMLSDAMWILRAYNKDWHKAKWGDASNVTPAFAADLGE